MDDEEPDLETRLRANQKLAWLAFGFGLLGLIMGGLTFDSVSRGAGGFIFLYSSVLAIAIAKLTRNRARKLNAPKPAYSLVTIIMGAMCFVFSLFALLVVPYVQEQSIHDNAVMDAKMISEGWLDFSDDFDSYPQQQFFGDKSITDKKLAYSWRVGILPYCANNNPFPFLDFQQAWNSPRNKTFTDEPVSLLTPRYEMTNLTPWQRFVGVDTLCDPTTPIIKPGDENVFPDGSSSTIFFAEAGVGVPWASPTDMVYNANSPLPPLGKQRSSTFIVSFADGSVRSISKNIDAAVLHAAIRRNDGQSLPAGAFD